MMLRSCSIVGFILAASALAFGQARQLPSTAAKHREAVDRAASLGKELEKEK